MGTDNEYLHHTEEYRIAMHFLDEIWLNPSAFFLYAYIKYITKLHKYVTADKTNTKYRMETKTSGSSPFSKLRT